MRATERRVTKRPAPKPERVLCVVLKPKVVDGVEYLPHGRSVGCVVTFDVNHVETQGFLHDGLIRRFDPARDSRGPSRPFRDLWTGVDGEWYPETEGWWAVRIQPSYRGDGTAMCSFQYGSVHHPRCNPAEAWADLDKLARVDPEFAARCEVVKLPCVMSNHESHVACVRP